MTTPILECRALTKRFGATVALDAITLQIPRGRIVGLLGPNGSGKTTLIKLANQLLTPTSGEILIDGKAPGVETKAIVSYLPDRMYLDQSRSVTTLLDFYGDFFADFQRETAETMLAQLDIDPKKRFKSLSKGTQEKVQLILTMSRRASLYLLDEPIGGVDPAARDYILHTILTNYNPDASVIISTHLIADVEQVLDDVIFIQNGKLVLCDSVDNIRETNAKSVDALFREVFRCSGSY